MRKVQRIVVVGVLTSLLAVFWLGTAAAQGRICGGQLVTIEGTSGDDHLIGTSGDDVIAGLQGNDIIDGRGGDDIICAGKGDDTVHGGGGFDIIFGAQGRDTLYASDGAGTQARSDSRGARMFGGKDDDLLYGSNRWDRMQGGPGNDRFFGFEGRDWIRGGPGADQVDGGVGIDDLHGGNGPDRIKVTNSDRVRGGAGRDLCEVSGEPSMLRSCGRNILEPPRTTPAQPTPDQPVVGNQAVPEQPTVTPPISVPTTNPDGTPGVDDEGREPGSGTPDYDTALSNTGLTGPCDLFTPAQLTQIVAQSANQSGAFADLPNGFGDGSDMQFTVSSASNTSCEWFSDSYIWFVGVSFEAADPSFVDIAFAGQSTFGTGFQARMVSDSAAQLVGSDLLVYIDNLVPGGSATSSDRAVTRALAEAIGARLATTP
ncbi:MAG: hypothetical protein ACI81L_001469 [Verrucomicrobiales bacterium]|jgi:hypothetical protein